MSPPGRRCPRLAWLLTVLWAVSRSRASQSPPSVTVGAGLDSEQLLRLIVHDVMAKVEPLVSKLAARIDRMDTRLIGFDARLSRIETRLDQVQFKQDSFGGRLDDLASRVDSTDSRLDDLASGVDGPAVGQSDTLANQTTPRDCSELPAGAETGIHMLQPGLDPSQPPVAAYCDMDTDGGGWTVIQRRKDIEPRQSFDLGWSDYKAGFGELDKEFWWGLENLWRMTGPGDRQYELRADLVDLDGRRWYAVYRRFKVASEADVYRLSVADYSGNAGDSLSYHNDQRFSTRDSDTDYCPRRWRGGWWYPYDSCGHAHLNGPHWAEMNGGLPLGNHWESRSGGNHSLVAVAQSVMGVRPVSADQ